MCTKFAFFALFRTLVRNEEAEKIRLLSAKISDSIRPALGGGVSGVPCRTGVRFSGPSRRPVDRLPCQGVPLCPLPPCCRACCAVPLCCPACPVAWRCAGPALAAALRPGLLIGCDQQPSVLPLYRGAAAVLVCCQCAPGPAGWQQTLCQVLPCPDQLSRPGPVLLLRCRCCARRCRWWCCPAALLPCRQRPAGRARCCPAPLLPVVLPGAGQCAPLLPS